MSIFHHPSFLPCLDRATAEQYVSYYRFPVLRPSSVQGRFAVTYLCLRRGKILHTLIRQNADNSVDDISLEGIVNGHYRTLDEFMNVLLYGSPPLLTQIAPALVPLLPSVVSPRLVDSDPIAIHE